jgi:predicted SprT family Zn-dependent metalloprotease
MPSAWITHVKKYATEHKISYSQALKKAGSTYTKKTE